MRNRQSLILYFFILIIVLVSIFLFVFKDSIADKVLKYDVGVLNLKFNDNSALNLSVLEDKRVKSLRNYVSVFSYEDLTKSQDSLAASFSQGSDIIIVNPNGQGAPKVNTFFKVRVGNSNPFVIKTKK